VEDKLTELVGSQSRNAYDWAVEFNKGFPQVEMDDAIGWFANAMMSMHDSICNNELSKLQKDNKRLLGMIRTISKHRGYDGIWRLRVEAQRYLSEIGEL
jgi:hypothetical protein